MAVHESNALVPTITVRAFIRCRTTMPSADFCCEVKAPCDALSHVSVTRSRSPEVSSTAFRMQPPNLQPVPLMDMGFVVISQFARHRRPLIRLLFIGSYVCSTLLSDFASRLSLALRYHFTSIRLSKELSHSSCRTCSAHKKGHRTQLSPTALLNVSGDAGIPSSGLSIWQV